MKSLVDHQLDHPSYNDVYYYLAFDCVYLNVFPRQQILHGRQDGRQDVHGLYAQWNSVVCLPAIVVMVHVSKFGLSRADVEMA